MLTAVLLSAACVCGFDDANSGDDRDDAWRRYEVYRPQIERHFVVNTRTQRLKYNHDSSIAWFRDRWFCLWNANDPPAEGRPGQLNYAATSRDGKTWTTPVPIFGDPRYCTNPVPCPKGTQWQPNLIVVDDVLWAIWSQNSGDAHDGCYVSTLDAPDGRWTNRLLEWDGDRRPEIDGKRWRLFPTQNPTRLRDGRVLAPVTMIGPHADDAPVGLTNWVAAEKRDSVIYTDDSRTWHVSPGAVQPGRTWAQWEPTVWQLDDGTVMMFARNNDFRGRSDAGPRPAEMLLWSESRDRGQTWTPHRYVPIETVCSRMHVLDADGNRFAMVHNDSPAGRFVSDRRNLALFFARGPGIDFVAACGLTGTEPIVAYPQMWIRGDALAVSYSQGRQFRSIKVALVHPLPKPDRYYLFPRDNLGAGPAPARSGNAYRFDGGQHASTRTAVDAGRHAVSAGAWILPTAGGVLLDTRRSNPPGGFVWALSATSTGVAPFVHLRTPEANITSSLRMEPGRWNYSGLSIDARQGRATFFVNGKSESLDFTTPLPGTLTGDVGHVGAKRPEESRLGGFSGEIRMLAVFGETLLGHRDHVRLAGRFTDELGAGAWQTDSGGPEAPTGADALPRPTLRFDPADGDSFRRQFAMPDEETPIARVTTAESQGTQLLVFCGETSAGVDLDENDRSSGDRVELKLRFRIERGDRHTVCTIGDANEPARVETESGRVRLRAGQQDVDVGPVQPGRWIDLHVSTAEDQTRAGIGTAAPAAVRHRPEGTWFYLGDGFPERRIPASHRFAIDTSSVRSRTSLAERNVTVP